MAVALLVATGAAAEGRRGVDARSGANEAIANAIISIDPRAEAAKADLDGRGPLGGALILVKDNIETAALPTTAGSLALAGNRTGRDAAVIARVRAAGGVILGKTNLSEWANFRGRHGSSGWSAVGGQTRNAVDPRRSPCGSSSGSAVAVALKLSWAAIGTETDGSITCPAAMNGIVGFKPTLGLVSRTGIVPISPAQDTAGPMARNVADAARLLDAMVGADPADPITLTAPVHPPYAAAVASGSLQGVRIGVLRKQAGPLPAFRAVFDQALLRLANAGAVLVPIDYDIPPELGTAEGTALIHEFKPALNAYLASLPGHPSVRSLADLIAFNRAHARDELRLFGQELFEEAEQANDAEAGRRARAVAVRLAGPDGIDRLLARYRVSLLVAPTAGPAWMIDQVNGDHSLDIGAGSLAAVAGYPHLTVPMGRVEGLPVGMSFMGGRWQDAQVLAAGAAFERASR